MVVSASAPGDAQDPSQPSLRSKDDGTREGQGGVGRAGPGGTTYLEDLHLLQHELLYLLVILGQHDDLLHCPAVWNGPGRTSVGLRMLGKGQSLSPFPAKAPSPLGHWRGASMLRSKDLPWTKGRAVWGTGSAPAPRLSFWALLRTANGQPSRMLLQF